MRPKVRILFDSEGERITEDKVIDLVESPFLYVVKPLDNEDFSQLK
jgi:hypothetical protein